MQIALHCHVAVASGRRCVLAIEGLNNQLVVSPRSSDCEIEFLAAREWPVPEQLAHPPTVRSIVDAGVPWLLSAAR